MAKSSLSKDKWEFTLTNKASTEFHVIHASKEAWQIFKTLQFSNSIFLEFLV